MSILSLINALLSLAGAALKYAADKQLMDAGAAQSAAKGLLEAMDAVETAKRARAAVRHDHASVSNDPFNRDRP